MRPTALLPLLLALLPACALSRTTTNHALDPAAIASLEPGRTTAREVAQRLGAPDQVVELGDRSAWLYEHTQDKQEALFLLFLGLHGRDVQADRCWVFFDRNDVLTHFGSTLEAETAEFDLPLF
ncbi:MAG: outer membrane protein assembly factor BamE [Planctomycetota bacterium]|nr:MAG: outer membrane protein assembly factor BamE [Planctomycetota bacterium]